LVEMLIRRTRILLAAGKRILTRRRTRVTTLEAASHGRAWRLTGHPCRQGTVQVHLCLPGGHWAYHFPGVVRVCSRVGLASERLRRGRAEAASASVRQLGEAASASGRQLGGADLPINSRASI
jgi:hypothetical protein